jgi:hypothetical protein
VVGVAPANGQPLWDEHAGYENGFDVAALGDELIITETNFPSRVADPMTGKSQAYFHTGTSTTDAASAC